MSNDLLTRLRKAAPQQLGVLGPGFTPEQVQRGLERMEEQLRTDLLAEGLTGAQARLIWAAMLDSFIQGVRDA